MTAGFLQLIAQGVEDKYLTNNPEITFFKIVYRRHTNFIKFEKIVNLKNKLKFGTSSTIRLKRLADLISRMYLIVKIPNVSLIYDRLDIIKLKNILACVGINIDCLILNSEISFDEYINIIEPYIRSVIVSYKEIINNSTILLNSISTPTVNIESIIHKYSNNNLEKNTIKPINIYDYYLNLLNVKILKDPENKIKYDLYKYFYDLYNNINPNIIKIINSNFIKKIINDTVRSFVFSSNLAEETFIDQNYVIYDIINTNEIILVESNRCISSYFLNLIKNRYENPDIYNLDFYLITKKYVTELNLKSYDSKHDLIKIKNDLINIFNTTLDFNIQQFILLLEIINKKCLKYGFLFYFDNNNIIFDDNNINIFCHKNKINNHYYLNWIRDCSNIFFNSLQNIYNNEKIKLYYSLSNYWSYFTLDYSNTENLDKPLYLCNILKSSKHEGLILENINNNIKNNGIFKKIYLFEFVPFIVMQNLYEIFKYPGGTFWKNNFNTNKKIDEINLNQYKYDLLNLYYDSNKNHYCLEDSIYDHIIKKNIKNTSLIHIFSHYKLYKKDDLINSFDNYNNINYLGYIYTKPNSLTANISLVPDLLFPLDKLLLTFSIDILDFIDSINNINDNNKINLKLSIVKFFRLYLLNYDEIPSSSNSEANIISSVSSIWNYICRKQMILYDDLFRNKILSPIYYKLYPQQYKTNNIGEVVETTIIKNKGTELCIGATLQQAYNIFAKFLCDNKNQSFEYLINNTCFYDLEISLDKIIDYLNKNFLEKNKTIFNTYLMNFELLKISNISINPNLFYGASLYNIFNNNNCNNKFIINIYNNNVDIYMEPTIDNNINDNDGYVKKIYNRFPDKKNILNKIFGEIHKQLKIVPMTENMFYECAETYMSIFEDLPLQSNKIIHRTFIDMLTHFKEIISKNNGKLAVDYYKYLLNTKNISLNETNEENINVIIEDESGSNYPSMAYWNFLIPTKIIEYTYNEFESIHDIIKFILDLLVQDLIKDDPLYNIDCVNQDILRNKLLSIINTYNQYLLKLEINGCYYGSYIDTRIRKLYDINANFAWAKYLGYAIIRNISLSIGEYEIDNHTGLFYYLDFLMNHNINKENAVNNMLGMLPELYTYDNIPKKSHVMYIPLKFWFCKYVNNALPIIALQYSDIELTIKLKSLEEVAYWDKCDSNFLCVPEVDCKLLIEYVCLDSEERLKLVESNKEYLIENIKYSGTIIQDRTDIDDCFSKIILKFNNMCKLMFWTIRFYDICDNNDFNKIINWHDFSYYDNNAIESIAIQTNEIYREHAKDANYYNFVQPYNHGYSSLTKNIFLYSFALYPKLLQPSGSINLSQLESLGLLIKLSPEIVCKIKQGKLRFSVDVFCVTTNILRIIGGLGGLVFL
jgi:Large eukaryotic DNA virus major capsid protein.